MIFELITNGCNENLPLIYWWEILNGNECVGSYVGKSKNGSRRPRHRYKRKVNRLLLGEVGHRPNTFRRIHQTLAKAVQEGYTIRLHYICNVEFCEDINQVERKWIDYYKNRFPTCCLNDKKIFPSL